MAKCPRCGGTGEIRDDRDIGAEFRKRREKAGMSGRQMAVELGYSAAYLSDLELGRRRLSPRMIKDYERVLKRNTYLEAQ